MAPEFGKPIHHLPLIPTNVLKTSRPRAARYAVPARHPPAPAVWREDRDLPIGSYVGEDGKRRKLGSRIAEAGAGEAAISSPPRSPIPPGARAAYREIGALGATSERDYLRGPIWGFDPRPCVRGDCRRSPRRTAWDSFDPRPCVRGDDNGALRAANGEGFDPRPCVRGDASACAIVKTCIPFRSTPLREGRPRQGKERGDGIVSIHAPA
jgi:hypothetical protein